MINSKKLADFASFCQEKYDLKIKESIIEDFMYNYYSLNQPGNSSNQHGPDSVCAFHGSDCAHITFDSVKCNRCLN